MFQAKDAKLQEVLIESGNWRYFFLVCAAGACETFEIRSTDKSRIGGIERDGVRLLCGIERTHGDVPLTKLQNR